MRSSNAADQLGSKLTPKLIQAISQSVISTKRGLMDTEHKVRVRAMQDIIDHAGHEAADLTRPFINAALAYHGDNAPPIVRNYLNEVASGRDQVKALSALLAGGVGSSLSQVISNYLAPAAYDLNRLAPNLVNDPSVQAAAVAVGITTYNDGWEASRWQGLRGTEFDQLLDLARTIPDVETIASFVWRGLMTDAEASDWILRLGYPVEFQERFQEIRVNLLTIADAALGVLRGDLTKKQGQDIAAANGYTNESFDVTLLNTGEPPGLEQLLFAYRRGYIDQDRLQRGVLQSRIRDEWWPTIFDLRYEPPSTADAVQASIQGYITKEKAKEYAQQNGLNPDDFDPIWLAAGEPLSRTEMTYLVNRGFATMEDYDNALKQSRLKDSYVPLARELIKRPMTVGEAVEGFVQGYLTKDESDKIMGENGLRDTDKETLRLIAGEPLSKTEMLSLYRRGQMTWEQVQAGLRQSRLKDMYIPWVKDLAVNYPGIYDIRLLLSEGAIDDKMAAHLLSVEGYPRELIAALIKAFSGSGSTANKAVTEAMIVDLYLETAINATELIEMLEALGYSKANAELIREVADWKAELAARNALISKVRSQYVGRKIDEQTARADLLAAVIPASVVDKVMREWDLEIAANVRLLSVAQITGAWQAGFFADSDPNANTQLALAYVEKLGYTADDAAIILRLKDNTLWETGVSGKQAKGTQNTSGA